MPAFALDPLPSYTHEASLALKGWAAPGTQVTSGAQSVLASGAFCLVVPIEVGFNLLRLEARLPTGEARSSGHPVIRTAAPMRHYRASVPASRAC